eukprot:SAG11_NODE_545_length_8621_cov_25.321521_5_plen_165_part_00
MLLHELGALPTCGEAGGPRTLRPRRLRPRLRPHDSDCHRAARCLGPICVIGFIAWCDCSAAGGNASHRCRSSCRGCRNAIAAALVLDMVCLGEQCVAQHSPLLPQLFLGHPGMLHLAFAPAAAAAAAGFTAINNYGRLGYYGPPMDYEPYIAHIFRWISAQLNI